MGSFVLWGCTCLAASKTFLQGLLTCLNFTLDSKDLFCWYKQKMNYGSSTSSWKPWRSVRLDLVLTMSNIYISSNLNPHTKFTSSSRSTEFKDILSWKNLSYDHKDHPNQHKNSQKLCDKMVASCCEFDRKSMKSETAVWSEFPNGR